jgi:hypothetical protein
VKCQCYNVVVSSIFPAGYASSILIGSVLIYCNDHCLQTTDFCFIRQITQLRRNKHRQIHCYVISRTFINSLHHSNMLQTFNSAGKIILIPEF